MAHARFLWTLPLWIAVAAVLFWAAPSPPDPPPVNEQEVAASQRAVSFVVRETKHWQQEHGDKRLVWDEAQGHLAIVIDDVGRELHLLDKLSALRFPLTFAVLPGSVYASGVQLRLRADRRRYREILLHMPMEPLDDAQMLDADNRGESFLRMQDDPATIAHKLELALAAVPAAVGVNNHMGSRLTADRKAMDAVMGVLHPRGLFFLDSRTTADTQAAAAAEAVAVPVMSRQIFLDNDVDVTAIAAQLRKAAELAKTQPVVAIGHPSIELHEVLQEHLAQLHAEGIGIYPLSTVLASTRREGNAVD